ncbi:MAG: hypothetical protein AAGE80_12840 [Pseudomonadota bacterium]
MSHLTIRMAVLAALLGGAAAQAQTADSGATIIGPDGKTTTVERSVTRGDGAVQGTVDVNRDDGRGYRRSFEQSRSADGVTRQGTVTTNRGRTYTREAGRSCADGTCSGLATVTGPKGKQWTRERSFQRTGRGQWEGTVTRTNPSGRQTTAKRWRQIGQGQ